MNPVGIISEWLQAIPPTVRKYILLTYAVAVVVVQVLALIEVDLDYLKVNGVLAILGGYLGFQSAANVPAAGDAERPLDVDPDYVGRHRDDPPVAPPLGNDDAR